MKRSRAYRRILGPLPVALALALGAPGSAEGQAHGGMPEMATGILLEPSHWAVTVARRLESLRLSGAYLPSQRSVPLETIDFVLADAADRARREGHALTGTVDEWHRLLRSEFGGMDAGGPARPVRNLGQRFGVGGSALEGVASPGLGEFEPDRTGAQPLADRTSAHASYDGSIGWGRYVATRIRVEVSTDGAEMEQLQLVGAAGPFFGAAGRVPVGYAHGFGGGVALSGTAPLNALQVGTRWPVVLPTALRHLGPVSFHTFFGRMNEVRHPGDPFVWGASGHFRPHSRVTLGVHRAALFGGDPEGYPVTAQNVFNMLVGRVVGVGFEDQIVSASGKLVLPTERWLPLEFYLEWGAEDATGAWWDVPGRVVGLWSPSIHFAPVLAVGFEFTHFGTSCCLNPQWYRHWSFPGSWASGDRTLGHPLGGDGREYLVHGVADLPDRGVRAEVRALLRERREENLFSPGRGGRSRGAAVVMEVRYLRNLRFRLDATGERGSDWTELRARIDGELIY